jgi:hypothetical protein
MELIKQDNLFRGCGINSGGLVNWERDGMPVKIDKNFELNGACVCRLRTKK